MRNRTRQRGEPADSGPGWGTVCYLAGSILLVPVGVRAVLPTAASQSGGSLMPLVLLGTVVWLLSLGVVGVYTLTTA